MEHTKFYDSLLNNKEESGRVFVQFFQVEEVCRIILQSLSLEEIKEWTLISKTSTTPSYFMIINMLLVFQCVKPILERVLWFKIYNPRSMQLFININSF